ncbi:MAG: signal peptidase II [Proteobacteria bacterium]|nr:signal peptidase II [Pseudomonadota bacterium]
MLVRKKLFLLGVFVAITVTFCDLLSKHLIFSLLDSQGSINPEIKIFPFFSLVKVLNHGVSFGMFNGLENSQIIFSCLQGGIALVLIFWLYRNEKLHFAWALGLIIGGAFGNVIDRIQNGAVADFLDFYVATYHWPAFNLADSCVFIGVSILLLDDFLWSKKS